MTHLWTGFIDLEDRIPAILCGQKNAKSIDIRRWKVTCKKCRRKIAVEKDPNAK